MPAFVEESAHQHRQLRRKIHSLLRQRLCMPIPDRTLQGLRCRWIYKGEHCGYIGDLTTCDKTLFGPNGCKVHFPDEPLRFGGFPTSADARALRV